MNKTQYNLLCSNVKEWNKWRKENPNEKMDLRESDFSDRNLNKANLSSIDLEMCRFNRSDLVKANLSNCKLSLANFDDADLTNADLSNSNLTATIMRKTTLCNTNLDGARYSYNFGAIIIGFLTEKEWKIIEEFRNKKNKK